MTGTHPKVSAFSINAQRNYNGRNPRTIRMCKCPSRAILNMWPNERPSVQTVARDVYRDILTLHFSKRHEQIMKRGKIMYRNVVLNDQGRS